MELNKRKYISAFRKNTSPKYKKIKDGANSNFTRE